MPPKSKRQASTPAATSVATPNTPPPTPRVEAAAPSVEAPKAPAKPYVVVEDNFAKDKSRVIDVLHSGGKHRVHVRLPNAASVEEMDEYCHSVSREAQGNLEG